MMNEEWRDIVGYEGYYQVSSLGRVRSLDRLNSRGVPLIGNIMKSNSNNKWYKVVILNKNSNKKTFKIHRLVAKAFIHNPENKPFVNHKDENKNNNNVDNLEWVTPKENSNYGTRNKQISEKNSKPIKVIYRDNTYEIWESATIFAKEYGNGVDKRNIVAVLKGRRKTHAGLRFEYV